MRKLFYLIWFVLMLVNAPALAALVSMTAIDTAGTTSFNAGLHWSDALAPSAGNDYTTLGYLLRTPNVAGNYTFAGDSLWVGGGNGGAIFAPGVANNNALINKTPTGTGVIITVNNLTLDGSSIRDGMGSADVWSIAGNILVTANGGNFINQCRMNVDSVLSGSGPLYVGDNGNGDATRITYIDSALNTYNGSITLMGSADARARLNFADNSLMNFVIGASGVNNKISGTGTLTLNGDFKLDLTGASTNVGDSWTIAGATSQTFSDTFTVLGFVDIGGNLWDKTANGALYEFSESDGKLIVIPEPATMVLLGLGSLALLRRRK